MPQRKQDASAAVVGYERTPQTDQRATQPQSSVDPDGTLHVRELTLRPSDIWSAEFRRYFVSRTAQICTPMAMPMPARTAAKHEWDRFDAWLDAQTNAEPLAWILNHYPVDVVDTNLAGVRVGIITPQGGVAPENRGRVLINLRGGGFIFNRGLSFGQIESVPVAALGRLKVVTVDYRQAPFASYPAASEDVEAVYAHLLREYDAASIGIFGCSAGGTLASQAVARFDARGLPRPGAVGLFSLPPPPPCIPAAWGNGWGDSALWFSGLPKSDFTESDRLNWEPMHWYMGSAASDDVEAYPATSDEIMARFPPTLLLSGTRDFAMSSIVAAHARLLKLGVDASLYIMEGGAHGAHAVAVGTPEAANAQAYIARWFDQCLAR